MNEEMRMTLQDAKALEDSEIIYFAGRSGVRTTAEVAIHIPGICLMRSSAGDTFDLSRDGDMIVATKV